MENKTDLRVLLAYIDPSACTYQEWTDVGMALKHEGYSAADWDDWSRRDSGRYHYGECEKKWNSFNGSASPVTGGTIYHMAVEGGYRPETGYELDWDSTIDSDGVVVDANWLENRDIQAPTEWHPGKQLISYLEALFEPGEAVGFVTKSWKNEKDKYIPKDKGIYNKTAGQLIEELTKAGDDIGSVVGDYDREGGAWIRFNPLDGNGVRNENVTDFRYALVESDDMEIEKQNALLRELELPIAVLVYSGKKSLHAIVKVDATDYSEYRKRVDYLYEICEKNGMIIDKQNRNPSRLSRMPGCERGDQKQYIVDTNIGKESWNEWKDWIESVNDNLPDMEDLASEWNQMPDLAPALIEDLLREGHKMLISGPSKAGKSFALIELCIAIAEGRKWLKWQCRKGKVLYINLELDRASCLHRFKDVYDAMKLKPENLQNIDVWNLRGRAVPMDKLAPKLIRRAQKRGYKAIILDPIYKVITGDENSADQMAAFCNQFDLICKELECAVIYCHHHSKGSQGQKKAADRSSGSGVFARDPDAVIDLIELELTNEMKLQQENKAVCQTCKAYLDAHWKWQDDVSEDDLLNQNRIYAYCENVLDKWQMQALKYEVDKARLDAASMTAWRIEGTLREFPRFAPVNLWFKYPVHYLDGSDTLKDVHPEYQKSAYELRQEARQERTKREKAERLDEFTVTFESLEGEDGKVLLQDIADQNGWNEKTMKGWFGTGSKRNRELCKLFEKTSREGDKRTYIQRKKQGEQGATV